MKLDLNQIRAVIQLLEEFDLDEIEVEHDDDRIHIRKEHAHAAQTVANEPSAAPPVAPLASPELEGTYVTSPFVGTFYRAPAPDADPFVELGDTISPGQVLCIVEAMKLMNEIEAETPGKIVEILVETGKPVEYGDRLFRIETA